MKMITYAIVGFCLTMLVAMVGVSFVTLSLSGFDVTTWDVPGRALAYFAALFVAMLSAMAGYDSANA